MRFENPANGYVEGANLPALWALLCGPAYFLAKGVWQHTALFMLLVYQVVFAIVFTEYKPDEQISLPGIAVGTFILSSPIFVIYACLAKNIVRRHYLRKGWYELGADGERIAP
jgi:uncharacterized oligopeptide transporter (OPT) family protein